MSIKRKFGLGLASAALGLSLIGGGTYAYFSDEATIHNGFAAGTLNLEVGKYPGTQWPVNFDLSNLRPGDVVERTFDLNNVGSLAIEDTYLDFSKVEVSNPLETGASANSFLKALNIHYFVETVQNGQEKIDSLFVHGETITLKDAIDGNYTGKIKPEFLVGGKLNLTPEGIDVGDYTRIRIMISFPETNKPQNELQGMVAKVNFKLDSRQVMGGKYYGPSKDNGHITGNEVQGIGQDWDDEANPQKYTIDPTKGDIVDPDLTDDEAWKDTGK
ncbi:TasA family protein [Bacillus sp. EB01]|uniref:TasA family protein n=1 Tax=Bacillus sp. EB01 TaxID=1347086 RepID=UPI0005C74556|nr:TasA family protein [Bacillus sp. EB01]